METILFLAFVLGVFWLMLQHASRRQKRGQDLHQAYRTAIASGDRTQALTCGQAYYCFLQNGKLTLNDELSIKKDLSGMV
ncbi:hypothetical protein GCM10028805_17550 [Spirosoma harenae]